MSGISAGLWLLFAAGTFEPHSEVKLTPREIEVGAFYDGAKVRVEGATAPRSGVIIVFTGSDREERFKQKARFGPFWMNADRVRISGAPSLILRFSSAPVASLLSRDTIARLHLDEASLTARMQIEPPPDRAHDAVVRSAYLALKKSRGTYFFGDAGVSIRDSSDGCRAFALEFHWPAKAAPEHYTMRVYQVSEGKVIAEECVPLLVARTGFPEWLAYLASNRASLYGLTAVLISVLAGFGIDFVTTHLFGGKRVAH
ncbi:MAG TPA: TIGR02186 family protein [Bryobacteraceae bacterium]|nr:TIGR02186 family protein [Bryobacteraceae bacterium]